MPNDLHTVPVTVFKGVSTAREKLFAEAGIHSVHDLLNYYPRAYENRGNVKEVFAAVDGETASFLLTVTTPLTNARLKSKTGRPLSVQRFAAADDTGTVRVTFFNRPFLKILKVGAKFRFYGVLERTPRGISLSSPGIRALRRRSGFAAACADLSVSVGTYAKDSFEVHEAGA